MRLITSQELSEHPGEELQVLFNTVSKALALTEAQSPERRNALAALENIERARTGCLRRGPRP
jgi:hypothetical protein